MDFVTVRLSLRKLRNAYGASELQAQGSSLKRKAKCSSCMELCDVVPIEHMDNIYHIHCKWCGASGILDEEDTIKVLEPLERDSQFLEDI